MTTAAATPTVCETPRLRLRHVTEEDAPFILALLNDPGWLRYIGDRGVRTLEDARRYVEQGPRRMYADHGFMYGHGYEDLDGHIWELIALAPPEPAAEPG